VTDVPARRRRIPRPVLIIVLVALAAALIYVLFAVVFPWVETFLEDPTLDQAMRSTT